MGSHLSCKERKMKQAKHIKTLGFAPAERLESPRIIRALLRRLIRSVGMTPLGRARIHEVPLDLSKLGRLPFEDEGGVTGHIVGYQTLSTSHVAIHTWPARKEFHLDIYSCKPFNADSVGEAVRSVLGATDTVTHDLSFACELPGRPHR